MIKKLYLPLVALLVLALSSCGKMGELSSDYFTTLKCLKQSVVKCL